MRTGGSGVDIGRIVADGVPGLGLDHDPEGYFDIHHSAADTFDKIDRGNLAKNVAAMAVMAYVLADMPERLVENRVIP
jgi:carboxypeptidase Q